MSLPETSMWTCAAWGKGETLVEMALAAEAVSKGPTCIDCHPSAGAISLSLQGELDKESLCFLPLSAE